MDITYDPTKSAANLEKRGFSFEAAAGFDFSTANIAMDTRHEYPEPRFQALGFVGKRLYVLVFTPTPTGIRVISMRKANSREQKRYEP